MISVRLDQCEVHVVGHAFDPSMDWIVCFGGMTVTPCFISSTVSSAVDAVLRLKVSILE